MPQALEIDTVKQGAIRDHLAELRAQPQPPQEAADAPFVIARGYLDAEGNSTPLGDDFLTLMDAGLMDDKGELTEDGQLYATSYRDALEDPHTYDRREALGLNEVDKGEQGGPWAMLGDFATKSVPNMVETFYNSWTAPFVDTVMTIPRALIKGATGIELEMPRTMTPHEKVNAIAEQVTGGILASEALGAAIPAFNEYLANFSQEKGMESVEAKRSFELHAAQIGELQGSQFMEWMTGIEQFQESRDALVAERGEEAVKQDEEFNRLGGMFILDTNNLVSLGAGKLVATGAAAALRASASAERMALKAATLRMGAAAAATERATLEAAAAKVGATVEHVSERAAALRGIGNEAQALKYEGIAAKVESKSAPLLTRIQELTAHEATLGADLAAIAGKAGVAEKAIAMQQRIAAAKQWTPRVVGQTMEKVGAGLVELNEALSSGLAGSGIAAAYKGFKSLPTQMISVASTVALGPLAAVPTAITRALAAGPMIQSLGNFSKILGKELIAERGSVPFWRRVANNSTITKTQRMLSHRMDEMTLGGRVTEVGKAVVKGTAHAYPLNLALNVIMDPHGGLGRASENALGTSLVFGGGMAGGGALFKGSKGALKTTRLADEINFTRNLLPSQKPGYQAITQGGRRMVATYAAAFPNLNWEFTSHLPSRYDPVTNTARINPASGNPIRTLIAHEVAHYVSIRNQMEPVIHSMLLGDAETPGLLRKTDGALAPEFRKMKDAYDARTDAAGLQRRPIEKIAEEYFNESVVDNMVSMIETGELSRMAGKTQLGRLIEATIPTTPILKDFFFRTGGAMEAGGRVVMGNGLLADGVREFPEARALMRKMLREMAGEASTAQRGKGNDDGGTLSITEGDPVIGSLIGALESDIHGNVILDRNGHPMPKSKASEAKQSSAGLVLTEAQTKRINDGANLKPGELQYDPEYKSWRGSWMPPEIIKKLGETGFLNSKHMAMLGRINTATKGGEGHRFVITYNAATAKTKAGKIRYDTVGPTVREAVPLMFEVTKDGNILVHAVNLQKLDSNIKFRAASKRGQRLYQGNTETIKQDVAKMMETHADPDRSKRQTDGFYQEKYGPDWEEHKNFINTIFGLMTKEQQAKNPMLAEDKIGWKENVYRTYRLDRISKAVKSDGPLTPFGYTYIKGNFLPEGITETP